MNLFKNLSSQISKLSLSIFAKQNPVVPNTAELAKDRLKFMMKNKNNEFVPQQISNNISTTTTTTSNNILQNDITLKEQNSLEFNNNNNLNIINNNNNNNNEINITKPIIQLINIKGIGPVTLNLLNSKGILTINDLSTISDSQCEDLKPKIKQIFNIRKEAQNLLNK